MSADPLPLFGICPACSAISDGEGLACRGCVDAAREFIRSADGASVADSELAAVLGEGVRPSSGDEENGIPEWKPELAPGPTGGEFDQVAARLQREAAYDSGDAYKPNQRCWVCEERRSCRLDPDFADVPQRRWICKDCEAVT